MLKSKQTLQIPVKTKKSMISKVVIFLVKILELLKSKQTLRIPVKNQ